MARHIPFPSFPPTTLANSAYDPGTAREAADDGPLTAQVWSAPLIDPLVRLHRVTQVNVDPAGSSGDPAAASAHLARPANELLTATRPTAHDRTWWMREAFQIPRFSGSHGVIRELANPDQPSQAPMRQAIPVQRAAPSMSWFAGSELTAAGVPAGSIGGTH